MRALVYRGPKKVRVEDKPEPRLEHPEDVIVRITRTAICGSDLHLYHGLVPDTRVGCTFGHEFVGIVEEAGPEVQTLKRGDRVLMPFNISCGRCFFCRRGLTACCDQSNPVSTYVGGVFGYSHTTGGYDGGQAEFVRVPFGDYCPVKIPDDLSDEQVLFLTDILPTGYQAAEMAEISPGETVVVFGAGPVGIFTARSAQILGAGRVIVVDHIDYRLEMARKVAPGCETVNFRSFKDIVLHLRKMTDGRGADACIDAVGLEADGSALHTFLGTKTMPPMESGSAVALGWSIESARKNGRVSIIGVYGPPWNLVPIGTAMNKGLTFRMGQCSVRRYVEPLMGLIREGRIDPTQIITHRLPLEEADGAYRTFAKKREDCVKCVLTPATAH